MKSELTPVQERNVRLSMEVVALKKKLGETQLLLSSYQQRLRDDLMLAAEQPDGTTCGTCGQKVKKYHRQVHAAIARSLIVMYLADPERGWLYIPEVVGSRSREEGKLAYWGLIEEQNRVRPDGGRAGWWRVTEKGALFVNKGCSIPKYAVVYNGRLERFEGPEVDIEDCLAQKFSYAELMANR